MGITQELRGTGVALVTPFNEKSEIDTAAYRQLIKNCLGGNVDYLVVNGTTAESPTTTLAEKQLLLDIAREEAKGKGIMFGLGGNNTADVVSNLKTMNLKGVNSILSVSPYYNKPSQEGIYQHYKAIAEASPVPVVLYNVPGRTGGAGIQLATVERLAKLPNIVGIKEASSDMNFALDIRRVTPPDFLLLSGDDMVAVQMIAIGGSGSISVLANAFPETFSFMINQALKGDFKSATEELLKFSELDPLLYEESNPVGIKFVLEQLQVCSHRVRLPLVPASASLTARMLKAMQVLLPVKVR
ncbi:MAG: dihydrodipicolinate synthase [Chitinophagaceae bacterium]|nr:dihydrodipicolinate synthase [Chitinophagaceae bacterium]